MWPRTRITKLLKITLPIIQAPMAGGADNVELAASVSNSGGLGSMGLGYMPPDAIRKAIRIIRKLTSKPFAINLFVPEKHKATLAQISHAQEIIHKCCHELHLKLEPVKPPFAQPFDEQMNVLIEEKIPIFSFTFGIPAKSWINKLKDNNITLIGTATTLQEAKALEENGIDIVVAQGSEAGGHRGTFLTPAEDALIGIMSLTPLLADHVKIPVAAAGGIMDGRGIVAALSLGASGVQMGSAFLSCKESGVHPLVKKILLHATDDNTTLTRAYSGKLVRGIKNKFIAAMQSHTKDILDYPIQNTLTQHMRKEAAKQNNTDYMSMWAGQAAYLNRGLPAEQLMKCLNEEVIEILNKF